MDIDFVKSIKIQLEENPLVVNISIIEDRFIVIEDSGP
jgi:hypothetical protein